MYTMKKCSFCKDDITLGTGIMFVKNDGTIQWFCSTKCRKNSLVLQRDPRKLKWASKKRVRVNG
jgi:large subunit ribosomal protein L24e